MAVPIAQWAESVGISRQQAGKYCRRGMPHAQAGKGTGHNITVDPAAASAWLTKNVARWRPKGGKRGGGRPRKKPVAAAPQDPSPKTGAHKTTPIPPAVSAAERLAESMSEEERREFLGAFGEVGADGRVSLRLDMLMRMDGAKVIQLKYALESMAKKVELDRSEGRLVEADQVRRSLGQKLSALEIALQQAVRTAAARIKSDAGLSPAQADAARRVLEEQVDQALVRMRGSVVSGGDDDEVP